MKTRENRVSIINMRICRFSYVLNSLLTLLNMGMRKLQWHFQGMTDGRLSTTSWIPPFPIRF